MTDNEKRGIVGIIMALIVAAASAGLLTIAERGGF